MLLIYCAAIDTAHILTASTLFANQALFEVIKNYAICGCIYEARSSELCMIIQLNQP